MISLKSLTSAGDEAKPSCQNCAKKGLKCKYGIQLTFHNANLFELDEDEAKELKIRGPERYESLQVCCDRICAGGLI